MTHTELQQSLAGSTMLDADFVATKVFKASPEAVFDALTTTSGLSSWWTPVTGAGLAGGELTFMFGNHAVKMHVDRAERPSTVAWTAIVSEPLPDWEGTTIDFAISPSEQGGATLHFRHKGLTPRLECFEMCRSGWTQYLASLVDYVDTGHGNPFGSTN